jgi:amino acid permease
MGHDKLILRHFSVHPSAGFALGWMQWYSGVVSLPTEIISATLIIGFWTVCLSRL